MKAIIRAVVVTLILAVSASIAFAQDEQPPFKQEELDQMLAPIALYPDSLLSQILMASTYPLEVVQAARWSRANPHLKGQDAVRAVEHMEWEPSVKSLVAFPEVLAMMDERLDWTHRLGEAFLLQEPHVLETVQGLRRKAQAASQLGSDERIRLTERDGYITIEPADPRVVYVPYYDPTVVYGPWWWPNYPPVYWWPPPGYYVASPFWPGFYWSPGIVISTGFFFGAFSWPHRHVTVVHVIRPAHQRTTSRLAVWKHDPRHRRGVPYRHAALQQRFSHSWRSDSGVRREFRQQESAPVATQRNWQRGSDVRSGRSSTSGTSTEQTASPQGQGVTTINRAGTRSGSGSSGTRWTEQRHPAERSSAPANTEPRRFAPRQPSSGTRDGRTERRTPAGRPTESSRSSADRPAPRVQRGQGTQATRARENAGSRPSFSGSGSGPRMEGGRSRGEGSARRDRGSGRGESARGARGSRS
jgi:hypothetical protein